MLRDAIKCLAHIPPQIKQLPAGDMSVRRGGPDGRDPLEYDLPRP